MAWRDFVCWWTCIPLAPSIYTISFLYSCTKLSTTCKNVGVYSGVLFLWNGGRFFIVIHCELYNFKAEVFKQVYSWKKVTLIHIVSISLALVSTNVSTDSISLHQLSNRVIIEDNWTQRNVSFSNDYKKLFTETRITCFLSRTRGWTQVKCAVESTWSIVPFKSPCASAFITSSSTSSSRAPVVAAISLNDKLRFVAGRLKVI